MLVAIAPIIPSCDHQGLPHALSRDTLSFRNFGEVFWLTNTDREPESGLWAPTNYPLNGANTTAP
jgi:hypothetical protein